ncbi:proteasome subunit alpha [Nigerium massiliense]|uniref:proteasome subunit alpha n=1 Tax=Nigerium massiliense TaxID=1522317 RepID=UPI00058F3346|nr:proteasome subunit alpha [Nigerium massiliense]
MSMPFYVSPEQQMKDRAEFARQGIARGRSVVAVRYADGLLFVAENLSATLHKVSEIYDRIGFAGVGRYHEFEALRVSGIRQADLRGYTYDREDVAARALVNSYAQLLGGMFAAVGEKPLEVDLVVGELGKDAADDRLYRLGFDGSVSDDPTLVVIGGAADEVEKALRRDLGGSTSDETAQRTASDDLATTLVRAVAALASVGGRRIDPAALEVGVLDRTRPQRRKFRRLGAGEVAEILGEQR